ncbi:MAG: hypothetical protein IKX37_06045 [Bacteroidales bacterium]|jgi:YD repeat-containing protein|nr:hypothetical protein [Bacteroidales bacterium]
MKRLLIFTLLFAAFLPMTAQNPNPAKKNLVVKEWNTDARGAGKRLDHITTYNADGKKLEETEYTATGQKWRKRYEYNGTRCIKELVYDERNRLASIKKYEYDNLGRKKTQYNYDAKGKLLTIKTFEYLKSNAD